LVKTARRGLHLAAAAGLIFLCSTLFLAACDMGDGATLIGLPPATGTSAARQESPVATAEPPTAPPATPTARPATPTVASEPATAETAGSLAVAGREVFATVCARCHGTQGEGLEGPPIIGEVTNLPAFATAQGLHNFIRLGMPLDAPGSLAERQYLEVLAFLLLENGIVEADTPLGMEGLDEIDLQ
jgi:mono/diheme cytochrome c family protein